MSASDAFEQVFSDEADVKPEDFIDEDQLKSNDFDQPNITM